MTTDAALTGNQSQLETLAALLTNRFRTLEAGAVRCANEGRQTLLLPGG